MKLERIWITSINEKTYALNVQFDNGTGFSVKFFEGQIVESVMLNLSLLNKSMQDHLRESVVRFCERPDTEPGPRSCQFFTGRSCLRYGQPLHELDGWYTCLAKCDIPHYVKAKP